VPCLVYRNINGVWENTPNGQLIYQRRHKNEVFRDRFERTKSEYREAIPAEVKERDKVRTLVKKRCDANRLIFSYLELPVPSEGIEDRCLLQLTIHTAMLSAI